MTTPYEITFARPTRDRSGSPSLTVSVRSTGWPRSCPPGGRPALRQPVRRGRVATCSCSAGPTPKLVAAARLLHPDGSIIAVIDADAPVEPLVGVLQAGADACVRAGSPAVLAGHLLASQRRRVRKAGLIAPRQVARATEPSTGVAAARRSGCRSRAHCDGPPDAGPRRWTGTRTAVPRVGSGARKTPSRPDGPVGPGRLTGTARQRWRLPPYPRRERSASMLTGPAATRGACAAVGPADHSAGHRRKST